MSRTHQDLVGSPPEESSEPRTASPPSHPFCARAPSDMPWRPDGASRNRPQGDAQDRRRRYGASATCLNAARMAPSHLSVIAAGKLAGTGFLYGGFGAQLRHLAGHPDACVECNMEFTAPLMGEKVNTLVRMARSRSNVPDTILLIAEPDRDRKLRVADEQCRPYNGRELRLRSVFNAKKCPLEANGASKAGEGVRIPLKPPLNRHENISEASNCRTENGSAPRR